MKKNELWRESMFLPPLKKLLRMARLTLILLMAGFMQVAAKSYSQNAKLSLELYNATIAEILNGIEEQSDYRFFYDNSQVDLSKRLNFETDSKTIGEVLGQLFTGTQITYEILGRRILLKPNVSFAGFNQAKQRKVTGKVTAATNEPIPGVTILIKGTKVGTITDMDGNYSLSEVPADGTLVFSFVGMKSLEVGVAGKARLDVTMQEETVGIEEVVAIGYGIQKKTSLTAAVSKMEGEKLASIPITNLNNGIGGRVSGVITRQASGEPGQDASSIYIRGISSTGSSTPLVIVDGIPRPFTLDPNTIESVTILKDASAVAPYGVAGANGVLLVTTKKGKSGKLSLHYNGYVGFQNPTAIPEIVDSYNYCNLQNIAARNVGLSAPWKEEELQKFKDQSDPDAYPNQNPYDMFIDRNTPITNHNFEISGGTENLSCYASFGYLYQAGFWSTNYADRYSFTIGMDAKVTETTKISANVKGSMQKDMYPGFEGTDGGATRVWEVMRAQGSRSALLFSNGLNGTSVYPSLFKSGYKKVLSNRLFTQLTINQELPFVKGLSLKGTLAYDPTNIFTKAWRQPIRYWAIVDKKVKPYTFVSAPSGTTTANLTQIDSKSAQLTTQVSLNYSRNFLDKHNIGALVLLETQTAKISDFSAKRINYELLIDELSMGSSNQANISNSGTSGKAKQVGLLYRINYDFASKYLFETTGRYDGHYYFAPGKRFGFFPAFSLGYRLSEENFMKGISWLDNLKIRASWGEVGALAGSAFQYLSSYNVVSNVSALAGTVMTGLNERTEANSTITWERAKKTNIGMEVSVRKGLLTFEGDYFYEHRSNMLVTPDIIVPSEYGISLSQVNQGEMENRGIDFSLGTNFTVSRDIHVSLTGNFTYAKNKLLQVFESAATYNNPNRRLTGRPLNTMFGYHAIGYFQVEDFDASGNLLPGIATRPAGKVYPGDIRYEDLNDDEEIDFDDFTVIGHPIVPAIIYGIDGSVRYKNFEFNFLLQGAEKSSVYKSGGAAWLFDNGYAAYVENLDYWTPENRNALNPRPTPAPTTNNKANSSHWLKDASYLRLKNATLSYRFPSFISQILKFEDATVFVSGQNLLTFTKFTNYDPEIIDVTGRSFPPLKIFSIGLNVSF